MMQTLTKPYRLFDETAVEAVYPFANPIELTLPGYQPCKFYVHGIARRRNAGPVLTLAIAQWTRDGFKNRHNVSDIVSMMRLADAISQHHMQPINKESLYGPRGRMCDIGRLPDGGADDEIASGPETIPYHESRNGL